MEHNEQRRSSLKKIGMGFAALLGVGTVKAAIPKTEKKVVGIPWCKKRRRVWNP